MGDFLDHLIAWAEFYGYPLVFFGVLLENLGLPLPGETVVLVAGFLASPFGGSYFRLVWIIPITFAAAVLGASLGYALGHRWARPRLKRVGHFLFLTPDRLKQVESYFGKYGIWTIIGCRFVTGLRVVCALAAGVAAMPWWRFFLGSTVGAAGWSILIALAGYYFGKSFKLLHQWLDWGAWLALALSPLRPAPSTSGSDCGNARIAMSNEPPVTM